MTKNIEELRLRGSDLADDLGKRGLELHPRVHGNGFIQVDLNVDGTRRLHVWGHPLIPQQEVRSEIHDHVFNLASEVIVGRVVNMVWGIGSLPDRNPTHEIFEADYSSPTSSTLERTGRAVLPWIKSVQVVGQGAKSRTYALDSGILHSSVSDGPSATIMTKIKPVREILRPRVLVPLGSAPDNDFSRTAHDTELLLGIIDDVVPRAAMVLDRIVEKAA